MASGPAKTPAAAPKRASNGSAAAGKTASAGTGTPLSPHAIGDTAGSVWTCLNEQGPQTLAQLKKEVAAPADLVLAAVGWLAREGKLHFEARGKTVTVSLL